MIVMIEHVNHIRENLGIPTQTFQESRKDNTDPAITFGELVCAMSDEIVDLKKRVKELEGGYE